MNIIGKLSANQKSAVQDFADALVSKQLQRHISIRFVFTKKCNNYGEIEIVEYNSKNQPREFVFYIDHTQNLSEKIRTIAHEFVHLKQYLYNELNEEMTLWKGQKISEDDYENYFDRPGEKEAETLGDKLFEEYHEYTKSI